MENKILIYIKSFVAGVLSTLIFHQGILWVINLFVDIPFKPYSMDPTKPFGVPSIISTAFFAGLWAVLIWQLVKNRTWKSQVAYSIILGAVLPTLAAFAIVLPLKGIEFNWAFIPPGLVLNGIWGFGIWVIMYLLCRNTVTKS